MTYRKRIGVLLVLCFACLTACASRSMPAHTAQGTPTDSLACTGVCVTLTDSEIASSRVSFIAAERYDFVVTNDGKAPKHFIIELAPPGPDVGSASNKILFLSSEISPGASRSFPYAFPIIAPQSALAFVTRLPGSGGPGPLLPVQVELE